METKILERNYFTETSETRDVQTNDKEVFDFLQALYAFESWAAQEKELRSILGSARNQLAKVLLGFTRGDVVTFNLKDNRSVTLEVSFVSIGLKSKSKKLEALSVSDFELIDVLGYIITKKTGEKSYTRRTIYASNIESYEVKSVQE